MIQTSQVNSIPRGSEVESVNYQDVADSPIESILKKIAQREFPEKEHFENYMRHKWRMNREPSTLKGSFHAVSTFLTFYAARGKRQLQDIVSDDLEAFIEHEQGRGLKVTTLSTRLNHFRTFLRYLIDRDRQ